MEKFIRPMEKIIRFEDITYHRPIYWFGVRTGNIYLLGAEKNHVSAWYANVSKWKGQSDKPDMSKVSVDSHIPNEWLVPCPFDPKLEINLLVGETFENREHWLYTGKTFAFSEYGMWHYGIDAGELNYCTRTVVKKGFISLTNSVTSHISSYMDGLIDEVSDSDMVSSLYAEIKKRNYLCAWGSDVMRFVQTEMTGNVHRTSSFETPTKPNQTVFDEEIDDETAALLNSIL